MLDADRHELFTIESRVRSNEKNTEIDYTTSMRGFESATSSNCNSENNEADTPVFKPGTKNDASNERESLRINIGRLETQSPLLSKEQQELTPICIAGHLKSHSRQIENEKLHTADQDLLRM